MDEEHKQNVFYSIYENVFPTLIRIAYHITKDMVIAEDLCQEAFIKLYQRPTSFPSEEQAKYWLIRIVKNLAFNHEKRKQREIKAYTKFSKGENAISESGEEIVLKKELSHHVKQAIEKLPQKLRIVLILREYGDLNYKEIAKILHISEGNVKVRIYRAREKLGEMLKKGGVDVS